MLVEIILVVLLLEVTVVLDFLYVVIRVLSRKLFGMTVATA